MHEANHVTDRVHAADFLFDGAMLIVEELDLVGKVHVIVHRVEIVVVFLHEELVIRLPLGNILDKVGNLLLALISPRVHAAPMRVEVLLHLSHLLDSSLFRILLHP